MNLSELQRSMTSGGLQPVYLVYGPEDFLRGEALRLIRQVAASRDKNSDILELDGAEVEPGRLFDELRTPGLFAPTRLIILESASPLLYEASDLFLAYVKKPASNATLALVAESVDGRRKGIKEFTKKAVAIECAAMKAREVPAWCITRARLHGKQMDPTAARLLVDLAGANLGPLDGHIQGLAAYCRERRKITATDVSDLVGGDPARTVWDLVRAIAARSAATALRALDRLLREPKTTPSWIVACLARDTRDLWQVKLLSERGCREDEIQTRLGKPTWLVRRLIETARDVSIEQLRANHRLLLEADVDSKTGGASDSWILESLVVRLCGRMKQVAGNARERGRT